MKKNECHQSLNSSSKLPKSFSVLLDKAPRQFPILLLSSLQNMVQACFSNFKSTTFHQKTRLLSSLTIFLDPRTPIFTLFHLIAHKLITKVLFTSNNAFFADLTKYRYNFDSFALDSYCFVGCCHFILQSKGKEIRTPD